MKLFFRREGYRFVSFLKIAAGLPLRARVFLWLALGFSILFSPYSFIIAGVVPPWLEKNGSGGYPLENFELLQGAASSLSLGGSDGGFASSVLSIARYREDLKLSFAPLFEGANYFSSEYFLPFSGGQYLYAAVSSINISDIPGTNELGEDTGRFGAGEILVRSGYTRVFSRRFSVGGYIKAYYQRIGDYQGNNIFTADGGCSIRSGGTDLYFLLGNIIPFEMEGTGGLQIYPSIRLGLKQTTPFSQGRRLDVFFNVLSEWLFSGYPSDPFWSLGAEYENPRGVKWRLGINPSVYVAGGIGFVFRRIDFDYGVVYHPLGLIHTLGVTVRLQEVEPTEAARQIAEEMERLDSARESLTRRAKLEKAMLEEERTQLARERKISALFLSASRDFGDKKFSSAMKKLQDILKIDPSNQEAKRLLSEIKAITSEATVRRKLTEMDADYKKSDYARVLENAAWILDVQPENEKARIYYYLAHARLFLIDKKYQDARGELYEVIKIQPTNSEALGLLKRIQTVMDMEAK